MGFNLEAMSLLTRFWNLSAPGTKMKAYICIWAYYVLCIKSKQGREEKAHGAFKTFAYIGFETDCNRITQNYTT